MQAKITQSLLNTVATLPAEFNDTDLPGFCLRLNQQGQPAYYARYRIHGKQSKYKLGGPELTPAQAREKCRKVLADAREGIDPVQAKREATAAAVEATTPQAIMTLREFIDGPYKTHWEAHSKQGRAYWRAVTRALKEHLDEPLDSMTVFKMEQWRNSEIKRGKKRSSVNSDTVRIKGLYTLATKWGLINPNPLSDLRLLKGGDEARVRWLDESKKKDGKGELTRLMEALECRERHAIESRANHNEWRHARGLPLLPSKPSNLADYMRPITILAMNTGLRKGELLTLEWRDIDLERKILTVRASKTKSKKSRHIPLNAKAQEVLTEWRKSTGGDGLVFKSSRTGGVIDTFQTAWRGIVKQARLDDFTFHDTRHHFASSLVQRGVDLNTVRELLGHSDISMTMRYAHLAPDNLLRAVSVLD